MIRPLSFAGLPRLRRRDVLALGRVRAHLGAPAVESLRRWACGHLGEEGRPVGLWARASARTIEDLRRMIVDGALAISLQGPDGQQATLVLDGALASMLVGLLLRTGPRPHVGSPTAAEHGLALYAVAGLLLELGAACPWTATIDGATHVPDDAALVEGELRLGGHTGIGWLLLDPDLAQRLPAGDSGGASLRRLEGVQLPLAVEIGRIPLPDVAELELLGPGDVVLSPSCPRAGASRPALLRVGEVSYRATVEGDEVRIQSSCTHGGLAMPTEERASARLAEQLPVELVVELGRLRLSAAQVLALGPGDVLILERAVTAPVDLRVGDRLIGRGELVDVEGAAGVRVVEVFD